MKKMEQNILNLTLLFLLLDEFEYTFDTYCLRIQQTNFAL